MSLPLPGVETVSLAARPAVATPSGPYPVIGVAETRQLGLADGQVVRPTVEVRNERLVLVLDGRLIEWPASARAHPAAQAVAWEVRLLASGSAQLLPLPPREGATTPAPSPPASALAAVLAREADPTERIPDRLARLLARPADVRAWLAVLTSAAAATSSAGPTLPGVRLPSMGGLDAQALRLAIARSGLFAESALSSGAGAGVAGDVKFALQSLLRRLGTSNPAAAQVAEAVEDIEAAQVQALSARADGGVLLHLVLGFRDAAPVVLRIVRDGGEGGPGTPPDRRGWSVDIHTRSDRWGPLWLHTRIEPDERVALVMWAERDDLCVAARRDTARLAAILAEQGLHLERLQVIHGARVDVRDADAARTGTVLDLKA